MFQQFAFGSVKKSVTKCARAMYQPNTIPHRRYFSSTKRVHFTAALKRIIGAEQKWRCAHCRQLLPASFQIDHIQALHKGGDNNRRNLQALCPNCHASKTYIELYEGGQHSIPSGESEEAEEAEETGEAFLDATMHEADEPDEAESTSMVVCEKCGVTHSKYFYHMCRVSGC